MPVVNLHTTEELELKQMQRRQHRWYWWNSAGLLLAIQIALYISIDSALADYVIAAQVFFWVLAIVAAYMIRVWYRLTSRKLINRYRGWYKLQLVILTLPSIILLISRIN